MGLMSLPKYGTFDPTWVVAWFFPFFFGMIMADIGFGLLFLAFGIAFETPVAIVLLVLTGFVTPKQLRAQRQYVLVGAFVVAAVLTPPDVLSQLLLAIPAYLLYEVGIVAASWIAPKKTDDDSPSTDLV